MKTKSEKIVDEILEKIKAYNELIENIEQELRIDVMNGAPYDPAIDIKKDYEELEIKSFVNDKIKELQKSSLKENYYFFDCSFEVYKNHYHKRKIKFIANNIDVDEADFIKEELSSRINKNRGRRLKPDLNDISYHNFIDYNISIIKPEEKKIEFLINELSFLGWDAYLIDDEGCEPSHYYFEKNSNYGNVVDNNTQSLEFKTSKELNDFICSKIFEINELQDTVGEDIRERLDHGEEDYSVLFDEKDAYEKEVKLKTEIVEEKIEELYYKSLEDNFYFFNCPLKVYKNTVDKRFTEYKEKFVDNDACDFLDDELLKIQNPKYNAVLFYNDQRIDYSRYTFHCTKIFQSSNSKKNVYLMDALKRRNDLIDILETTKSDEEEVIKTSIEEKTNSINDSSVDQDLDQNIDFPKDIFINQKHYQYYMDCLRYLNAITEEKETQRGFSAIAHAVFKNKDFQDYIFKVNTPLKNYIKFLTEEFNFNKTSRLSNHLNHENSVSKYTSDFDIKELSNKKE